MGVVLDWINDSVVLRHPFLLVVTGFVLLLCWIISKTNPVAEKGLPPGSYGWPIIGETLEFVIHGHKFMNSRIQKYGPVFKTSLLGVPTVVVSGSSNVRHILTGEGSKVKLISPTSLCTLLGEHTITAAVGLRHRALHRRVIRFLRPEVLTEFAPMVHAVVRDFVARWRQMGDVESCVEECRKLSFNIATKVLLPLEFDDSEGKKVMDLFNIFNAAALSFPVNIPGFGFRKGMAARRKLITILNERVIHLVNSSAVHSKKLSVILEMLRLCNEIRDENDNELSSHPKTMTTPPLTENTMTIPEEFQDMVLELAFASFETTASMMCALIICLAQNDRIKDRVRQELVNEHIDCSRLLTYAEVQSVTYVGNVVNEALRLMPPIAGAFRKTLQPMEILDYHIPVGWTILYTINSTHNLASRFDDNRSQFTPERWENKSTKKTRTYDIENGKKPEHREPFDFIPFGGGPRICVGKEFAKMVLRLFIIEMTQTGSWSLANGPPEMRTAPIPFPKDNLPVRFEAHI